MKLFLLNLLIFGPSVANSTATGQANQREHAAPPGTGGRPQPTLRLSQPPRAPLLTMQRKVFLRETLPLFLELMKKIGQIIYTQQVFVSFHPEVWRKDISRTLHPAE